MAAVRSQWRTDVRHGQHENPGRMNIQVNGKQIETGQALATHVRARMIELIEKYAERAVSAQTTFSREGHEFRADCHVHLSNGKTLLTHGVGGEIYLSFEEAATKLEKRLRRLKRKLTSHHQDARATETRS